MFLSTNYVQLCYEMLLNIWWYTTGHGVAGVWCTVPRSQSFWNTVQWQKPGNPGIIYLASFCGFSAKFNPFTFSRKCWNSNIECEDRYIKYLTISLEWVLAKCKFSLILRAKRATYSWSAFWAAHFIHVVLYRFLSKEDSRAEEPACLLNHVGLP